MPISGNHILTEGSDFLNTEGSDRLITETGSETGGAGTASLLPGRWQFQALAFVPLVITTPALNQLQPIHDAPLVMRQAPALTAAIRAGSFFGPTRQPTPRADSWYPRYPDIIFRTKDPRYTYPSSFRPDQRPFDVPDADSWYPCEEVPTPRLPEAKDLSYITPMWWFWTSSYVADYAGTLDMLPPPMFEARDQRWTYPSEFRTDLVAIPASSWHPLIDIKMREPFNMRHLLPPFEWVWTSALIGDYAGTLDMLQPPMFERPDFRALYPYEGRTDLVVSAPVVAFDWMVARPDLLFRARDLRYTYPSLFFELTQAQRPEAVSIDRFAGYQPERVHRLPFRPWLMPFVAAMPERQPEPRSDSWFGYQPERTRAIQPRTFAYQWLSAPERQPDPRPLSWAPDYPDMVKALTPARWAYQKFAAIPSRQPDPPALAWAAIFPDRVYGHRPRVITQYDYRVDFGIVTVVPPMDSWYMRPEIPVRRIDNRNYITIGDLVLTPAQRPERITPDKWLGSYPDRVYGHRPRFQFPWVPVFVPVVTPEVVTVDKWFMNTVGPKFLRKDYYYIAGSGWNFQTIVPPSGAGNQRLIIVDGRLAIQLKPGGRIYTFI